MYGHSHTGLGALILTLVALLHKMTITLHQWGHHKAHAFTFQHHHYQWFKKIKLEHTIAVLKALIAKLRFIYRS